MKALGIDFGASQIRGGIVNEVGELSNEKFQDSRVGEGREATVLRLRNFIQSYLKDDPEIKTVGVGTPGPIDWLAGTVLNSPNLPGWEVVPLQKLLQEGVEIPIVIDRDANVALIGEHWVGEAKGLEYAALLTWGTGVGGAIIASNRIYRGHSGLAGELGHLIIDKNGPQCHMGHCGCLESFIGGKAVEERYGRSLKDIAEGARGGNEEDKKVAQEIGEYLKIGLRNIVTILDPSLIVLDGSVVQSIDVFLPEIEDFPVKASKLALKAGVIGAARMAMEHLREG